MSAAARAEAGDEVPGLPRGDELLGVHVGHRKRRERGAPDQFGHGASRAERDDGAEHRVLDDACQKLDPARDHRLHHGRVADAVQGRVERGRVADAENHPAAVDLVHARLAELDRQRIPERVRRLERLLAAGHRALRDARHAVGREQPARGVGREPGVGRGLERGVDDGLCRGPVDDGFVDAAVRPP